METELKGVGQKTATQINLLDISILLPTPNCQVKWAWLSYSKSSSSSPVNGENKWYEGRLLKAMFGSLEERVLRIEEEVKERRRVSSPFTLHEILFFFIGLNLQYGGT